MTWEKGCRALRNDKIVGPLIKEYGVLKHKADKNYFRKLVFSIVSQQISGKAAAAIQKRIEKHYGLPLRAQKVLDQGYEVLGTMGLSRQKMNYIYDLAGKFVDGTITPRRFHRMTDEEIIQELILVKGIGRWTAEMFLIFSLERFDVFPVDDYGIQKAIQNRYGLKELPKGKKLLPYGEQWRPYRSVATLYLWKSLDSPAVKTEKVKTRKKKK